MRTPVDLLKFNWKLSRYMYNAADKVGLFNCLLESMVRDGMFDR